MERWQKIYEESLTSLEEVAAHHPIDLESLRPVVQRYPLRITRYYFSLIRTKDDPIWRQVVPDLRELEDDGLPADPLDEVRLTVSPGLIHRYPDRALLLVASTCPTLCRFCTRKNQTGFADPLQRILTPAIEYLWEKPAIREVILSGGDPLLRSDEELEQIFSKLRKVPHVEIIRIHTRAPVTLPDRITPRLCRMLKRYHPLFVNTQFNHPSEITDLSARACMRLVDAGIPVGNQTVLLKGVNDQPEVMKELMRKLLNLRVRPYYLHQMDPVRGASHFRTPLRKGLEIMDHLRGHISGMATPTYVIDLPGGKGKVSLLPEALKKEGNRVYLRNYLGEIIEYPDAEEER